MGFLDKVRNGLKKTKESLIKNIETVVIGYAKIDDDFLEDLEMVLLSGDLGVRTTDYLMRQLRRGVTEGMISSTNEVMPFMEKTVVNMLTEDGKEDISHHPEVYLVVGVNGVGKTTTIGKLSAQFHKEGKKVLLAAADTFRAAASEQLAIWAERTGADIVKHAEGADPAAVAFDAVSAAKARGSDVVLIDTAGRLQIDEAMMQEIAAVKKAVNPVETLLVADAMTGQNAAEVAKAFDEQAGLTGVILTKFDSDARGGAALSLKTVTGKPILYVGVGEKIEDFEPFYPDRIAGRILGMGDIVSLVEKAQETIDAEEAARLQKKMATETFTLSDMLDQLENVEKMGSIESMLDMMPGLAGQISAEDIDKAGFKRQKAIIQSMTLKERENHYIIGPPRRKRIAKGSGTSVAEVNKLLKQFEKTRQTMRKVAKSKGLQARLMGLMG